MTSDLSSLAAREAARDIQSPTGGHGDVWSDLIRWAEGQGFSEAIIAACRARRELGISRYGQPLRYDDGRGEVDALQEALDLAVYLYRDGWRQAPFEVLGLAETIVGVIGARETMQEEE